MLYFKRSILKISYKAVSFFAACNIVQYLALQINGITVDWFLDPYKYTAFLRLIKDPDVDLRSIKSTA